MVIENKKESPLLGASIRTNQNQITIPAFSSQAEFHLKNLDRLIDQDIYWFCRRIEALKNKNYGKVQVIETTYLVPLQIKIKELAKRMAGL